MYVSLCISESMSMSLYFCLSSQDDVKHSSDVLLLYVLSCLVMPCRVITDQSNALSSVTIHYSDMSVPVQSLDKGRDHADRRYFDTALLNSVSFQVSISVINLNCDRLYGRQWA